jgi:hypothetical protein
MSRAVGIAACLVAIAVAADAAPDGPGGIDLAGHVEHALHLTVAELKALPQSAVDVTFQSGHGPQSGHFAGPLLWDLVQKAGIAEEAGSKAKHHLQHALLVTGRDGYVVALAVAEIDPDFEGKSVILADEGDELRLIVPGDKFGGRDVRDVVRIEVE